MSQTTTTTPLILGFLTVLQEGNTYLGGYLVTNAWGRPLEFRLSTAVQPNRVQQVLYANTLQPYVYGDLIGKALVDKTTAAAHCILTDCEQALDLRRHVDVAVAWITRGGPAMESGVRLVGHREFPQDRAFIDDLGQRLEGLDLAEPFGRIREAMAEARKMKVTAK